MGNENERKRDPAKNRENWMGGGPDQAKTGGEEKNVGLTGTTAGSAGGQSAGSGGAIGGSADFLAGESQQESGSRTQGGSAAPNAPETDSDTRQVLTGETGDEMFSGQPQSGTSFIAGNRHGDELGASGAGAPGSKQSADDEPAIGPGGQSEIGGASDLGGGETGLGDHPGFIGSDSEDDSSDFLREDGNPDEGFAEQGRGAPDGSQPTGPEGTPERTANRDSDIEGSSKI